MRPAGPVPLMAWRSMPFSAAILRASGEALMRSPVSEIEATGAAAFVGAGALCAEAAGATTGALAVGAAAESPFITARMPPITAFWPSATRISLIVPSSNASISMVALSVSISASTSPISTLSPTFLCHLITVPSVMVSESLGISMLMAMGDNLEVAGRMGEMVWISSLFTSGSDSRKSAAWIRPGRACKA